MKAEHEILLPLDERNLAHVLAALALTGIAAEQIGKCDECRCWWNDDGFRLRSTLSEFKLIENANGFVRALRWIPGLGASKGKIAAEKYHGTFICTFIAAAYARHGHLFAQRRSGSCPDSGSDSHSSRCGGCGRADCSE